MVLPTLSTSPPLILVTTTIVLALAAQIKHQRKRCRKYRLLALILTTVEVATLAAQRLQTLVLQVQALHLNGKRIRH